MPPVAAPAGTFSGEVWPALGWAPGVAAGAIGLSWPGCAAEGGIFAGAEERVLAEPAGVPPAGPPAGVTPGAGELGGEVLRGMGGRGGVTGGATGCMGPVEAVAEDNVAGPARPAKTSGLARRKAGELPK